MGELVRTRARVTGVVQGVGFRPFVYSLATRLGLTGFVGNDVDGVFVEVEGRRQRLEEFLAALRQQAPPLAEIESVSSTRVPVTGAPDFVITDSEASGRRTTLIAADSATCTDCLDELDDPTDRRYGYPFINCTNCGPRFTIVTGVPYDRPLTTMADFAMCVQCSAEYHDPADRRFHAQPVCCAQCGPRLRIVDSPGQELSGEPITVAAAALNHGAVLAVKGLGGYHLAASVASEQACATLRARKHREDKAFAVMVPDVASARNLCEVQDAAQRILTDRRRPIVLLPRRPQAQIASAVAPHNRELGLMLAYTPLHELLLRATGSPVVLTSGNVSEEPIAYRDTDALERLTPIADVFLTHDRAIHTRVDDSVVRPPSASDDGTGPILIRRSRGYAPEPLTVPWPWQRPVLACGAELKNTFCLASDRRAFLSQHIGDLENLETLRSFTEGIEHFQTLFEIAPEVVAHDLHPEYLSTKHATTLTELVQVGIQHHHAHIAACLADNHSDETVIGVAFDGTGYGTDGTIWGGEFLLADVANFERVGFLDPVPMPGAAAAIRHPWRMAAAHLQAADVALEGLAVRHRNSQHWDTILEIAARAMNAPLTSSAGRLFDAVAAIAGIRDSVNYEGQAAVELEQAADLHESTAYPASVGDGTPLRISGGDLVHAVACDIQAGTDRGRVSARFHNGLAEVIVRSCDALRERTGHATVALSGGVFANMLLYRRTVAGLERSGFRVLAHARVPCNDGGISFGQAVVAGARDRAGLLE